jgi:hypothetical protein
LISINRFLVPKPAEYALKIPQLSDYLYEAPVDLLINLYHENKYVLTSGPFPERYFKKLDKGNYRAVVQLRHKDDSLLEKFKDLPLGVRWKLASPISLDCYRSHKEAFSGDGSKLTKLSLRAGRNMKCFFAPIPEDK